MRISTKLAVAVTIGGALSACTKSALAPTAPPTAPQQDSASFAVLFASQAGDGDQAPNLFQIEVVANQGASPVLRAGDLPATGSVVKVDNLPVADAATITASLYRQSIQVANRTHSCKADGPVKLSATQVATASLTCVNTVSGLKPIKVFVKLAKATLTLDEKSAGDVLSARDWTKDSLYASTDSQGRRVTLKQDSYGLTVHIGGDISYYLATGGAAAPALPRLLAGETLVLSPIRGRLLSAAPETAQLKLSEKPLLFEEDNGDLSAVLGIDLVNTSGAIASNGRLLEEPAKSEFTVVSYNVENFFDQTDEDRNASYGDYRIAPNTLGQVSNWGQPVAFNGQTMSFTDVKVAGIRKALIGIDPAGPEIVGLVEVESKASLDKLLAGVADLGYVAAQFTEWSGDIAPTAIGAGLLTKYPIKSWSLIKVSFDSQTPASESERPILKATLDVNGYPLIVYVNHWKSKSGKESMRKSCAMAVEKDIEAELAVNPRTDYIVLGDLNSDYNETVVIEDQLNDTNRETGINHVLRAQGDELAVLKGLDTTLKYNLHYELDPAARKTAWYPATGWGTIDNMIIGSGAYDRNGITYIDNSFQIATPLMPSLKFLFMDDGTPNRWHAIRVDSKVTRHEVGGYSDHLPIFARFQISKDQSPATIWLGTPGKPDAADPKI